MQAVQFLISVILARLLLPGEFGLIAMLGLFVALASSILDSGFGSALIQKQNASRKDESSVFYFNIGIAVVLFGVFWLIAPAIANLYAEPTLIPLARFLGFNFIINSFGLVQGALLTKRLDFKTQSQVAVAVTLLSGGVGVTMALKGFGVWSLAALSVVANLARVLLFWRLCPWRPVPSFSMASLKSMFPYGSRLLCAGLLNTVFENIYQMLIGLRYSKVDLGFYTRALSAQRFPVCMITGIFSQVAFPALASIHDDRRRLKSAYRKLIVFSGFLTFPLMLGLLAVARPIFLLVFSEKWASSIVYFRIFCLAGLFFPLQALNLNVLMAVGRSNLFFRLEVVKKTVILIALLATVRFGILAMVWGQFASSIVCLVVNTYYTGVTIDYPLRDQLRDVTPSLSLAAVMASAGYAASLAIGDNLWLQLLIPFLLGTFIYFAGSVALRLAPFLELRKMARERLIFLKLRVLGHA